MKFKLTLAGCLAAAVTCLVASTAYGDAPLGSDTTYGQDPVPDSQYWSGPLPTYYGVDPVPSSHFTEAPYQRQYGQDPVPGATIGEQGAGDDATVRPLSEGSDSPPGDDTP